MFRSFQKRRITDLKDQLDKLSATARRRLACLKWRLAYVYIVCYIILYNILWYYILLYFIVFYFTILYCIILYILYYTILYCIIYLGGLKYVIFWSSIQMLLVILEELNLSTCIVWGGWFDIFLNNRFGDDSPILTRIVLNGLKTQQLELVASLVTRYKEIYVNWNVVSVETHELFLSTWRILPVSGLDHPHL